MAASVVESDTVRPVLRPGPSAIPRGQVSAIQRERILSAVVETIAEVGYARMTVAQVIARARVSRKTFYEVFCGREHCFLAASKRRSTRRLAPCAAPTPARRRGAPAFAARSRRCWS